MAITDDPRERLVKLGQEVLDTLYEMERHHAYIEETFGSPDLPREERVANLKKKVEARGGSQAEAIIMLIHAMTKGELLHDRANRATDRYIEVRATLEALDKPRQEVPHD